MRRTIIVSLCLLTTALWMPTASAAGSCPGDAGIYNDGGPDETDTSTVEKVGHEDNGVYVRVDHSCQQVVTAINCAISRLPGAAQQEVGNVVLNIQLAPEMRETVEGLGFTAGPGARAITACLGW